MRVFKRILILAPVALWLILEANAILRGQKEEGRKENPK
jgi:hypothetical protein